MITFDDKDHVNHQYTIHNPNALSMNRYPLTNFISFPFEWYRNNGQRPIKTFYFFISYNHNAKIEMEPTTSNNGFNFQ